MGNDNDRKLVSVRFFTSPSSYIFDAKDLELRVGDKVLVGTENGQAVASVVNCNPTQDVSKLDEIKPIVRKLTEADLEKLEVIRKKERDYFDFCRERIRARKLPMELVQVEQAFDGSKTTFYFVAEGRVDFRDLLKDLVERYRIRIELRQIGTRQETAILGGIGSCGRELCCASYLTQFQRISVKMAKNQNLTLNPSKISGQCGKLKCCLAYEKDVYSDLITNLPKIGKRVFIKEGQGQVVSINVLEQTFVAKMPDRRFIKGVAGDNMTEEEFLKYQESEDSRKVEVRPARPERSRRPAAGEQTETAKEGEEKSKRPRRRRRRKPTGENVPASEGRQSDKRQGEKSQGDKQDKPAGDKAPRKRSRRPRRRKPQGGQGGVNKQESKKE